MNDDDWAELEAMVAPSAVQAPLDWWVRLADALDEHQLEQLRAGELYHRVWGRLLPPAELFADDEALQVLLDDAHDDD